MPEKLRGTYAGLASESAIQHLLSLGVTAVELMPVHFTSTTATWSRRAGATTGATTPWPSSPPPSAVPPATPREAVQQFKMMVRALHAAGIEVILDVVYNHTAEGNQLGPTLSMRGVDNASYYRLSPQDPRYYMDFTGCGNTLNMSTRASCS